MAKKSTLEEILNEPFRWPRRGDEPFITALDPLDNANITQGEFSRLVLMMDGYKEAADLLVAATESNPASRDSLVFPIVFNYRQFIELGIKYLIATYGPKVNIEANWNTHDLTKLWRMFAEMLDKYGTTDPDKADVIVMEIVAQFAKIDEKSYSFRYPVDRRGVPISLGRSELHLSTLADVMQAVDGYFNGCDGYLSSLADAMDARAKFESKVSTGKT